MVTQGNRFPFRTAETQVDVAIVSRSLDFTTHRLQHVGNLVGLRLIVQMHGSPVGQTQVDGVFGNRFIRIDNHRVHANTVKPLAPLGSELFVLNGNQLPVLASVPNVGVSVVGGLSYFATHLL